MINFTQSASNYIAAIYEQAIDAGMDVHAMRLHLTSRGIVRSPAQLQHDLDHTYAFAGYWASHPAPPPPDVAALDLAIQRMTPAQLAAYDPLTSAPSPSGKRTYVSGPARRKAAE